MRGHRHLSGFDYFRLEQLRSQSIDWYNVQFYNGWGSLDEIPPQLRVQRSGASARWRGGDTVLGWSYYDEIIQGQGWQPERVVLGLLTNPRHGGSGYVGWDVIARRLGALVERYPQFGGVMGWEYWDAVPELEDAQPGADKKGALAEKAGEGEGEEDMETHYWIWPWRMRWLLSMPELRDRAITFNAGRSMAGLRIPNVASPRQH